MKQKSFVITQVPSIYLRTLSLILDLSTSISNIIFFEIKFFTMRLLLKSFELMIKLLTSSPSLLELIDFLLSVGSLVFVD